MGSVWKIAVVILLAAGAYQLHKLFETPPVPDLKKVWWGPGTPSKEDTPIEPFKINVSNEVLVDLQDRLKRARQFTQPLEGIQHQYGLNSNLLRKFIDFWLTKYDWREREKFLNQYPQFKVSVQGLKIHYVHVKPKNPQGLRVLPLLVLHGWPGSVREFYELIPLLTTPQKGRDFVFEIIAPSLPGYGFSDAAVRPGLGAIEMAVLFNNFMQRLGYKQYYIQGGDWGAVITQHMATLFPNQVLGAHSNMCFLNTIGATLKLFFYSFYPSLIVPKEHEAKVYPQSKIFSNLMLESGYMHLQSTKPDTAGVGLNDSPVGLAAYILEKFITWTDPNFKNYEDGNLSKKFSYTKLLDNIMIYWVTQSITTSMRLYSETFNKAQMGTGIDRIPITIPTACARFSNELTYMPTKILEGKYTNLVHVSDHAGGHFAALEVPEVLSKDIFDAIGKILALQKTA